MDCPRCHAGNAPGERLCGDCGSPLPASCPSCGSETLPGKRFCADCGASLTSSAGRPAAALAAGQGTPERRQVTVLFCDLVGSTELSNRLDPEDLSRVMRQYQDVCAGVIRRFEGFLAKFMGDGVLAYFGYPQTHEDAAERAASAGLTIAAEMSRVGDGTHRVRVGIATGLVVVGEMIGSGVARERTIVGGTPNVAARLQALAEPNAVLISDSTHRLLGNLFEYAFLGEQRLKGVPAPVPVWRVVRARNPVSRFQAMRSTAPLVGRRRELAWLVERWRHARAGTGQLVLLKGEAGIGKSRLVEAMVEHIGDEARVQVRLQCSLYHRQSSFYPVRQYLGAAAGFAPDDPLETRRDKLRGLVASGAPGSDRAFEAAGALMGLGTPGALAPDLPLAQRERELMLALAEWLAALGSDAPVLLLLEDAHWIDPSTEELIGRLADRIGASRMLAVVTHRPEFEPPWRRGSCVAGLTCERLGREDCAAVVRNIAAEADLPADVVDEVLRRSEGVPLFVEELTRAVIDPAPGEVPSVPPTLQDSLVARLDRLGRVKDIAQRAAAIGREFSGSLLRQLPGQNDDALASGLAMLVASGLVSPCGGPAEERYTFRHALLRDAAYETLLKSRRQELHGQIARALAARHESGDGEPELVAQHFSLAGLPVEAARYWELAGDQNMARSSCAGALAGYDAALAAVRLLPDDARRTRRVVDLQLKRGPPLLLMKGLSTEDYPAAYREAYALGRELGDDEALFRAGWGLWMNEVGRQRYREAAGWADELIALSRRMGDDDLLLEAIHCRWGTAHYRGEVALALELGREGAKRYDRERHARFAHEFGGHDAGVCALGVQAQSLCLAALPLQAEAAALACLDLAEALGQPHNLVHAFLQVLHVYYSIGKRDRCAAVARRLLAVADRLDLAPPRMVGEFYAGWAEVGEGRAEAGLPLMESAFARRSLSPVQEFYFCAVMAETLASVGRNGEALDLVTATLAGGAGSEIGFSVPELWRLKGELLWAGSRDGKGSIGSGRNEASACDADARACLERACALAESQGALLLQLRAATSLARVLAASGEGEGAAELLRRLCARLSEGFDTPDLAAATGLLEQLAADRATTAPAG